MFPAEPSLQNSMHCFIRVNIYAGNSISNDLMSAKVHEIFLLISIIIHTVSTNFAKSCISKYDSYNLKDT